MMFTVATETIERSGGDITPLNSAEEPYAIIPLHGMYGQGKVAKVSLCDVERVGRYKWYGQETGYVVKYESLPGNKFQMVLLHRFILGLKKHDGVLVDHEKSDGLDNRRSKIRIADHTANARNRQRRQRNRIAGYTGVNKQAGKYWKAFIKIDYKQIYLGAYSSPEEAGRAYDAAARYHFGEFAACNFDGMEAKSFEQIRAESIGVVKAKHTSQFLGVHWAKEEGKWKARINVNNTRYALGAYSDELVAARAFDAASRYFFGPKAQVNFSQGETYGPATALQKNRQADYENGSRSSPHEGVYPSKGRWAATLTFSGKRRHIGYFEDMDGAAKAYDDARIAHGLPRVNFPD